MYKKNHTFRKGACGFFMKKSTVFEISSVKHTPDAIRFTWPDLGGTYYVYRDGELLYEGTVSAFSDGQFKHAKLYHYSIERVVDDKVIDVIRLQTSPYAELRNVENPLQFLVMTTIVARTQIALSWEMIKDVACYEVYRNDVFLGKVQGNQYIDRDISLEEFYVYRIQSSRLLKKSEERFSKGKSIISTIVRKLTDSKKEPAIENFVVIKRIGRLQDLLIPTLNRERSLKVTDWKFRYMTFLTDNKIKNPYYLSRNRQFQGDDRDFDSESERFRTRVDVAFHYQQPRSPMFFTKCVGKTIAYNNSGNIRKIAVAPADEIKLERTDHQIGESGFILTHDVRNPLVQAPGITYEVQAVLRKDGLFDLTGFHNQAPHHEVYLTSDGSEWIPIHLAESRGLIWMADVMGWNYWRHLNFV